MKRRRRNWKRGLLGALLFVPGLILLLCLSVLLIPALPFIIVWSYLEKRRFFKRYAGTWLLVSGRRGGWYDFVANNVIPALPMNASHVWHSRGNRSPTTTPPHDIERRLAGQGWGVPK